MTTMVCKFPTTFVFFMFCRKRHLVNEIITQLRTAELKFQDILLNSFQPFLYLFPIQSAAPTNYVY